MALLGHYRSAGHSSDEDERDQESKPPLLHKFSAPLASETRQDLVQRPLLVKGGYVSKRRRTETGEVASSWHGDGGSQRTEVGGDVVAVWNESHAPLLVPSAQHRSLWSMIEGEQLKRELRQAQREKRSPSTSEKLPSVMQRCWKLSSQGSCLRWSPPYGHLLAIGLQEGSVKVFRPFQGVDEPQRTGEKRTREKIDSGLQETPEVLLKVDHQGHSISAIAWSSVYHESSSPSSSSLDLSYQVSYYPSRRPTDYQEALRSSSSLPASEVDQEDADDPGGSVPSLLLASADQRGEIAITDVTTGQVVRRWRCGEDQQQKVRCMMWSKAPSRYGDRVLFAAGSRSLFCGWDTRSKAQVDNEKADFVFKMKKGRNFFSFDFVGGPQDSDLIAISSDISTDHNRQKCSFDENISVWDVVSGAIVSQQPYPEPWLVPSLKMHPNGKVLVAQTHADYVVRILVDGGTSFKLDQKKRYEGGHQCGGSLIEISTSPRGDLLLSGSSDGRIAVYDWKSSRLLKTLDHFVSPSQGVSVPHIDSHPLLEGCFSCLSSDCRLALFR